MARDDDEELEPEFDNEHSYQGVPLDELDPETQLDVMRNWFFRHYTNPLDNTPYESREGGYIYIWGGPYDARRALNAEFSSLVPDELIDELADELNNITTDWTGNPDEHAVDEYEFDTSSLSIHRDIFDAGLANVELLLLTECGKELMQPFLRLLYANVITALETYLFDFFSSAIQQEDALFRKFVEENEEFTKKNIKLSQVLVEYENIAKTVREFLIGLSWHNLPRVKPLFKNILEIEFDDQMVQELIAAVAVRHDIVHRNGRSKESNTDIELTESKLRNLLSLVRRFVTRINQDWRKLKGLEDPDNPF
jgi:hypothetical protein